MPSDSNDMVYSQRSRSYSHRDHTEQVQPCTYPITCPSSSQYRPHSSTATNTLTLHPNLHQLSEFNTIDMVLSPANPPACLDRAGTRIRILKTQVHIATLELIAALLLLLVLLWHISTVSLVENHMMPDWWVKTFVHEHVDGWRIGVWVGAGVLVSKEVS